MDIDAAIGPTGYEVSFSAIEPRIKMGVAMKREEDSRVSTQKRIESRPAVLERVLERQSQEKYQTRLYGPQQQVPWVGDRTAMKYRYRRDIDVDDSPGRMTGTRSKCND